MEKSRGIIPVILCGGKGSRLWPLSRPQTPKHLLHFGSETSLFQQTLLRCVDDIFDPRAIVVTSNINLEKIFEQMREIGRGADLCLEPFGRNSCPAIAFACFKALERNNNPTLLILPSDHLIDPVEGFIRLVEDASSVQNSHIITFGFKPDTAHTGYGYIEPGDKLLQESGTSVFGVKRFIEKPDENNAQNYLEKGFLWNSGIFLIKAKLLLGEMERYEPLMLDLARQAYDKGTMNGDCHEMDPALMETLPSLSIDYGILEKSDRLAVCPANVSWRDIGNWDRAAVLFPLDNSNNRVFGTAEFCESRDNLVHSPNHKTCLVGVDNLAVVVTQDAVLVSHRSQCEKAGKLADQFSEPVIQVKMYPEMDYRPWGQFQTIDLGSGYQVKRLKVEPGQTLSLQSHCHRAEHWIVVSGKAEVTIGALTKSCGVDESVYIPKGSVHRLANRGLDPLILIEVQTGDYLGEDDIVRLEDAYDRVKK